MLLSTYLHDYILDPLIIPIPKLLNYLTNY